jgi:hypothetical protein
MGRPSCKLDKQAKSPYRIVKKIRNLFKLDLLDRINIYSIFLLDKL